MLLLRRELKETLRHDERLTVVDYNGKLSIDYIVTRVVTLPKCFHSDSSIEVSIKTFFSSLIVRKFSSVV